MPTELFTSKATYPNNIVIPPVALRHPAYYIGSTIFITLTRLVYILVALDRRKLLF